MTTPRLHGPRVGLRPFRADDAPEVQRLAGDPAIAATTATIPHPYPWSWPGAGSPAWNPVTRSARTSPGRSSVATMTRCSAASA